MAFGCGCSCSIEVLALPNGTGYLASIARSRALCIISHYFLFTISCCCVQERCVLVSAVKSPRVLRQSRGYHLRGLTVMFSTTWSAPSKQGGMGAGVEKEAQSLSCTHDPAQISATGSDCFGGVCVRAAQGWPPVYVVVAVTVWVTCML